MQNNYEICREIILTAKIYLPYDLYNSKDKVEDILKGKWDKFFTHNKNFGKFKSIVKHLKKLNDISVLFEFK